MARFHTSHRRRGVVLLVILSLLVLFALLGVTFAIVAGQYRKSSTSFALRDQSGDEPGRQLDSAMYVMFRDTPNIRNPLRGHGLLTDIYGFSFYKGTLANAPTYTANGQFLQFNIDRNVLSQPKGYFNGCVLTFLGQNMKGVSTRIVYHGELDHSMPNGTWVIRVLRPRTDDASASLPASGDPFLINGRAFSGTGAGYNSTSGKLDMGGASSPTALQPNRVGESNSDIFTNYLSGGPNEAYDAADLQNMFLGAIEPDSSATAVAGVKMTGNTPNIIPSYHRPSLIRYAQANGWTLDKVVMRPLSQTENPTRFTAGPGFPSINLTNGPWDIDNDNDGLMDSVWVDLDFPMQTSPDGRAYKPLFAILCLDMDGKLNLNHQGNSQHYNATNMGRVPSAPNQSTPIAGGQLPAITAPNNSPPPLPTGLVYGFGLGPGEVNLATGLGLSISDYKQLLEGSGVLRGRQGTPGSPTPGGAGDLLDKTRYFEEPMDYFDYFNALGTYSSFGSPSDLQGQLAYGVDHRGQLTTTVPTDTPLPGGDRRFNVIYRTRMPHDERFTPAEFERILRYYDIDSSALPRRLEYLTSVFSTNGGLTPAQAAENRRNATIDSRDIPVATPGAVYTPTPGTFQQINSPLDLIRARLGAVSDADLIKLVDPMLYHGIKMDINRPLGDGKDNSTPTRNGVVDEPTQNELQQQMADSGFNLVNGIEDLDNDPNTNTLTVAEQALARYQLAKHLYVLASIVVNTGSTPNLQTQYALAQWAINVVDFRDADSIMTPFEFDPNPFDGWGVDGSLSTTNEPSRGVVWGCERPELLLSESLALHDRRTTDTKDEMTVVDDNTGMPSTPPKSAGRLMEMPAANNDEHFDQQYMPQGSLFFEIYNPWTSTVQRPPAELYGPSRFKTTPGANQWQWTSGATPDTFGVNLAQTTPYNAPGDPHSPVWRVLIVKDNGRTADPDDPDPTSANRLQVADIDRSVYFVDISEAGLITDGNHGTPYYSDRAVAPIKPGRYAIVGSGAEQPVNNEFSTVISYNNTLPLDDAMYTTNALPLTRQIVLRPDTNPDVNQFEVRNNTSTTRPQPSYGAQVQPVVAVVVNKTTGGVARRLSVSEPVGGYDLQGSTVTPGAAGMPDTLAPVLDVPLDFVDGEGKDVLMKDGTKYQFRVMHLQRLANPLLPYDPDTNPYRTIDSIGTDITCFNGITSDKDNGQDENDVEEGSETLQRGDHLAAESPVTRQLWKQSLRQEFNENKDADPTHYWGWQLQHTLGYLNSSYAPAPAMADMYTTDDPSGQGQYLKGDLNTTTTNETFPLLSWNNRPYHNVYELLNVPRTHSSMLTRTFSLPQSVESPYADVPQNRPQMGYGHLLNYFYVPTGPVPPGQIAGLYRIFDFLRVPSKFVESDTYFGFSNNFAAGTDYFQPPFHRYSNFRDPGLTNVNTIYSEKIWNAVKNGASGPTFAELVASRRGYGAMTNGDMLLSDSTFPTEFANPFREAGSGKLVPLTSMERPDIEVSMMRSNKNTAGPTIPTTADTQPLFANRDPANDIHPYNNVYRHHAFRHSTMGRLANTLTTRSNVYAVWITVGYFEVDPNTGLLGQEVGTDTGEIRRHRAFYMVDRSIPVAFEPGENHNVDRAVLLRRFIE